MQEQIVTFETAKLAKEKGFEIFTGKAYIKKPNQDIFFTPSYTGITTGICYNAPTQLLLQKWLRDEHNTHINIYPHVYPSGLNWLVQAIKWDISMPENGFIKDGSYEFGDNGEYKTYEEALEKGLFEALKVTNEKEPKTKTQ